MLEDQAYRLAYWKIAFEEINYRRFFDINDLVCLRVEEEDVFLARHQIIFQLVEEGKVTGLRVDHVDGLHDPEGYLARLQTAAGAGRRRAAAIRRGGEDPGQGRTAPAALAGVRDHGLRFRQRPERHCSSSPAGCGPSRPPTPASPAKTQPFAEICYARNKQVMWKLFAGEVNALGHHLGKLAAQDRQARDVPLSELMGALVELTACLPVYRTYIRDFEVSASDRGYLERTLDLARRRTTDAHIGDPAFDFLRRVAVPRPAAVCAGSCGPNTCAS